MKATETKSTKQITRYEIELTGDEVADAVADYIKRNKKVTVNADDIKFHADCDCVYSASVISSQEDEVTQDATDI